MPVVLRASFLARFEKIKLDDENIINNRQINFTLFRLGTYALLFNIRYWINIFKPFMKIFTKTFMRIITKKLRFKNSIIPEVLFFTINININLKKQ